MSTSPPTKTSTNIYEALSKISGHDAKALEVAQKTLQDALPDAVVEITSIAPGRAQIRLTAKTKGGSGNSE